MPRFSLSNLTAFVQTALSPLSLFLVIFSPIISRFLQFCGNWYPGGRPSAVHDPASVVDRWVRELEDETGARWTGRADLVAIASGTQAGPGPTTLSRRTETQKGKRLPDFHLGSYESALQLARTDVRPLCVMLVSEEHDDVADFKRYESFECRCPLPFISLSAGTP